MNDLSDDLIIEYMEGRADREMVNQLERLLHDDPKVRRRFTELAATLALIDEGVKSGLALDDSAKSSRKIFEFPLRRKNKARWKPAMAAMAALAAVLLIVVMARRGAPLRNDIQLEGVSGTVTVLRSGNRHSATTGMVIQVGDRVLADNGACNFTWTPGISIRQSSHSAVAMTQDLNQRTLAVESGEVAISIQQTLEEGDEFVVAAGDWQIVHIGTEFTVSMARQGPRVMVSNGSVNIQMGSRITRVDAGQSAIADYRGHPLVRAENTLSGTIAHPFAVESRWNTPVGPSTPTRQLNGMRIFNDAIWITTEQRIQRLFWSPGEVDIRIQPEGGNIRIPLTPPVGAIPKADYIMVSYPQGGKAWECYGLSREEDGSLVAERVEAIDLSGFGSHGLIEGQPACAGMIVQEDLDADAIHHVLAFHLTETMMRNGGFEIGQRLLLTDDHDDPKDRVGALVASALRTYGAMVFRPVLAPQVSVDGAISAADKQAILTAVTAIAPRMAVVVP